MSQEATELGSSLSAATMRKISAASKKKSLRSKRKNPHMTLAQMRAIIVIWNVTFGKIVENGREHKLTLPEKEARFPGYKKTMGEEFGRSFKPDHKWSSEAQLIARYTCARRFLCYKLGRSVNLDPYELTGHQRAYYLEIGGEMDINKLFAKQANIVSLKKASKKTSRRKRKFRECLEAADSQTEMQSQNSATHSNSHNHNQKRRATSEDLPMMPSFDDPLGDFPPKLDPPKFPGVLDLTLSQIPKVEPILPIESALQRLNEGQDKHEKELLEKKKHETHVLCLEKLRAFSEHVRTQLQKRPEMIGCQVGAGDYADQAILLSISGCSITSTALRRKPVIWNILGDEWLWHEQMP